MNNAIILNGKRHVPTHAEGLYRHRCDLCSLKDEHLCDDNLEREYYMLDCCPLCQCLGGTHFITEGAMTLDEIKRALIGRRMSAGGEWYSEGTIDDVKIVEFEGEECLFLYEKEHPNDLWCWFPIKDVEALIKGESVSGGQPDYASIDLINW